MEDNIDKVLYMIHAKCTSSPVRPRLQSISYKMGSPRPEGLFQSAYCFEGMDYFYDCILYRRHRKNHILSYAWPTSNHVLGLNNLLGVACQALIVASLMAYRLGYIHSGVDRKIKVIEHRLLAIPTLASIRLAFQR